MNIHNLDFSNMRNLIISILLEPGSYIEHFPRLEEYFVYNESLFDKEVLFFHESRSIGITTSGEFDRLLQEEKIKLNRMKYISILDDVRLSSIIDRMTMMIDLK